MNRILIILIILLPLSLDSKSQEQIRFIHPEQSQFQIPFEISQNLIILPARVNGSEKMKFILDTGISHTIITEMTGVDTVMLNLAREVQIAGLGEGDPNIAWFSSDNEIIIESQHVGGLGIIGENHQIFLIPDDRFQFSKQFGLQINGLIGSDFFLNYVVEINYINKLIVFHQREEYKFDRRTKRHTRLPLIIEKDRPYLEADILQHNGSDIHVKLLIDTGASMALWLSLRSDENLKLPDITSPALIGQGLNGNIAGVNGRIKGLQLGPFYIDEPIAAFPDSSGIAGMLREKDRNGTIGNEILKRFHVIFDYQGQQIFLKPNKKFNEPFNYNRSGLEIEKPFYNVPIYHIYNVVPGSPADMSGLKKGDQIERINFINAVDIELNHINSILYGTEGKTIRLVVRRDGALIKARFSLENIL